MSKDIAVHWFRQDLRLSDNPSFTRASKHSSTLPIYILDDNSAGDNAMGGASRVWLHHSLQELNGRLNSGIRFFSGNAKEILITLCKQLPISAVYWNRCYEPWRIARDQEIKKELLALGIQCESFNGSLLWEPWQVLKKDKTPYKVFTPYYRNGCLGQPIPPRTPIGKPRNTTLCTKKAGGCSLQSLSLNDSTSWGKRLMDHWTVGETTARKRLRQFLKDGLQDYKDGRNYPSQLHVSRLSPHLHFGEISPHQIWTQLDDVQSDENLDCFKSELGWREFSHSLLYHFPTITRQPLQEKFKKFPWKSDQDALKRWQQGMTGYPIIDAAMRELWQTGYMHNRPRMIVGSFLVKNLRLHWHEGEAWFWDCLLDADLASNSASWQWVAGCGADAAPYFRVFNPITQGEKFDKAGEYTRRFVPELSQLPDRYLFKPWTAPQDILKKAGIQLGRDYPNPIVDVKTSREEALSAFKTLKT